MKKLTAFLLLLIAPLLQGAEISSDKHAFSAELPSASGWSKPFYQESQPHAHRLSWTARNEKEKEMIYVSIIDAPLPDKKPTFKEDALEWENIFFSE